MDQIDLKSIVVSQWSFLIGVLFLETVYNILPVFGFHCLPSA